MLWQGYYQYCNYLTQTYRNVPLPGFKEWYETIYNTKINNIQGFPQSPEFQETISGSVSPTNFEIPASFDKAETQIKRHRWDKSQTAVLINLWKKNFKLTVSTNNQSACGKIKVSVDAAGSVKSIRHCKDKIKNLKDTCK